MTYDARENGGPPFRDRRHAGRVLAGYLMPWRDRAVVLGVPRGGVVLAHEAARVLGAELDVVVAKKLGAPGQPELAIGAVAADGTAFVNDDLVAMLGVPAWFLEAELETQRRAAALREAALRGPSPAVPLEGRVAIVVDDGLATGATVRAAVRAVRRRHPARVIAAAPVGSTEACAGLRLDADEVICPYQRHDFRAVGRYYLRFEPVGDDEVQRLLAGRGVPAAAG